MIYDIFIFVYLHSIFSIVYEEAALYIALNRDKMMNGYSSATEHLL